MYKFSSYLFIVLFLFSCNDNILEENPKSFLTEDNFPATEEDAISMTNAVYSDLKPIRAFYSSVIPSDIAYQGLHNQRNISYFVSLGPSDGEADEIYENNYQGIPKANAVIEQVPNLEEVDSELADRLVAEASFLRAYYYFELVRTYGGVPILDEVIANPDQLQGITRSSVSEVYEFIKSDLNRAIQVLPEEYGEEDKGRATRWAAEGILAKVHMTLEEYSEAIVLLDNIINSNQFGLVDDYSALFTEEAEYALLPNEAGALVNEVVWQINYLADERNWSARAWTGSRNPDLGGNSGLGGGYENMIPTDGFPEMFEDGDIRFDVSYVTEINGVNIESPITPGVEAITGKWTNGFRPPTLSATQTGQNLYVLRYADILLLRAEAENELNGPENAYQYINQVRNRAEITPLDNLSPQEMREAIRKERATELSFEGHRRYDLLRWGIFVETIRNVEEPNMEIPKNNIQEHHNLYPIPQREIDLSNGSLDQNPGY